MKLDLSKDEIVFKGDTIYINGEMYMNDSPYKSIQDIEEDLANTYVVYEYVSNFSLPHIVSAFSEEEAVEESEVEVNDVINVVLLRSA